MEIDVNGEYFYFMKDGWVYSYCRATNEDPSLVLELRAYTQYPEGSRPWNQKWTGGNVFKLDTQGNICYLSNGRLLVIIPGHDPYRHSISQVDHLESSPSGEVIAVSFSNVGQPFYYLVGVNGPENVELIEVERN